MPPLTLVVGALLVVGPMCPLAAQTDARPRAVITGTVTDGRQPLAGARLTLESRVDTARFLVATDSAGRFRLAVPAGRYELRAGQIGFASETRAVQLAGSDTLRLLFALQPERADLYAVETTSSVAVLGLPFSRLFNLSEPNYFITGFEGAAPGDGVAEPYRRQVKFRVAIRYRLLSLGDPDFDTGPHLGYRQNSFWHLYSASAPFYDNNYNPQLLLYLDARERRAQGRAGEYAPSFRAFVEHESNGRDGPTSRAWNRFGAGVDVGDRDTSPVLIDARVWQPFAVGSENPDLPDRAGRGEVRLSLQPFARAGVPLAGVGLTAIWRVGGRPFVPSSEYDLFLGREAFARLGLCPLACRLSSSLLVQYYTGSGESLRAYQERRRTVRVGVATVR